MVPLSISVDDHVVEPPDLWTTRLPEGLKARGPRVDRIKGVIAGSTAGGFLRVDEDPSNPASTWVDVWVYEDFCGAVPSGMMQVHNLREVLFHNLVTYDDIPVGCWQQDARLADMDLNGCQASLNFPTVPRFCGQTFLERRDKGLALACIQVYNDWMLEEWCSGVGRGRLLPMTLVPLWDGDLAAAEARRCAARGSCAIAFSECPPWLGLPSIFSGDRAPRSGVTQPAPV